VHVDSDSTITVTLTLLQARQLANELTRQRKLGVDIIEQHKVKKSQQLSAAKERTANIFELAIKRFFIEHRTKHHERPRRWRDDARLLGLIYPKGADPAKVEPEVITGSLVAKWADRPIAEISSHDVFVTVSEAGKLGIPGMSPRNNEASENRARKMFAALSVLFGWMVKQRLIAASPCAGLERPRPPKSRERVLSDAEIVALWKASDTIPQHYAVAVKLLLLTGARLAEVTGMRPEELGDDGVWTIASNRTKNHRRHQIALSPLARQLVTNVPRIAVGSWSKVKRRLDAAMGVPAKSWQLHDLRRTFASGLLRLGIRVETIERCLNHVSGGFGGIVGVYQRDPLTINGRSVTVQRRRASFAIFVNG
jgi:integrase